MTMNLKFRFHFYVAFLAVSCLLIFAPGPAVFASEWEIKVDEQLLQQQANTSFEFIVYLSEQADVSAASPLRTKSEKGRFVFEILQAVADRSQQQIVQVLEREGVPYRTYWVANFIWVHGDVSLVEELARRPDVAYIHGNPQIRFAPVELVETPLESPTGVEWNIAKVNADDLWALGVNGSGAVVAGADTGYEWDHPAIINQYRGWDGAAADHNYNWHDAIHEDNQDCLADSPVPCDDHGHGTHTIGTAVGDDGGVNQIGMAPGARWIGCRNMNDGYGTPASYAECFQWFIAPTDLNNENPDPTRAPDVINNSWACPVSEGCEDKYILEAVVENTRAAGIMVVASAGNSGASQVCGTINNPIAIYDATFTVGGTTSTDARYGSSSLGPVWDGSRYLLKPEVSAPAYGVKSAVLNDGYAIWQGTSMAAPHVTGLAALLIDARPELAGNVDLLEFIIAKTALGLTSTIDCDPFPGSEVPNAVFGYGRIDALAAYNFAIKLTDKYFPLIFHSP